MCFTAARGVITHLGMVGLHMCLPHVSNGVIRNYKRTTRLRDSTSRQSVQLPHESSHNPKAVCRTLAARLSLMAPSDKMIVDESKVRMAPPELRAEFEVIVQSVAVTVEMLIAAMTPPNQAEFEVIVQFVVVTMDASPAAMTPPNLAEFEVIVQFVVVTMD